VTRQCERSNTFLPTRTDRLRWRCEGCGRRVRVIRGRVDVHYVSSVKVAGE
jgi:hypothetical protein